LASSWCSFKWRDEQKGGLGQMLSRLQEQKGSPSYLNSNALFNMAHHHKRTNLYKLVTASPVARLTSKDPNFVMSDTLTGFTVTPREVERRSGSSNSTSAPACTSC
jgi:hypothetical protein